VPGKRQASVHATSPPESATRCSSYSYRLLFRAAAASIISRCAPGPRVIALSCFLHRPWWGLSGARKLVGLSLSLQATSQVLCLPGLWIGPLCLDRRVRALERLRPLEVERHGLRVLVILRRPVPQRPLLRLDRLCLRRGLHDERYYRLLHGILGYVFGVRVD